MYCGCIFLTKFSLQLPWQGRSTWGGVLVLVPSEGSMEEARGMAVVHLISVKAVVLLLVTFLSNCRTWISLRLTQRGEYPNPSSFFFLFSFWPLGQWGKKCNKISSSIYQDKIYPKKVFFFFFFLNEKCNFVQKRILFSKWLNRTWQHFLSIFFAQSKSEAPRELIFG